MKDIKPPLGLINPDNLQSDEFFLIDIHYEMFPKDTVKLFKKDYYFVVWENSHSFIKKKHTSSQQEFPLSSLPWFIDTIENKFWGHTPDPNAIPGEVNEVTVIDGEKIGINPMRHCCAENLFGYSLWNASRKSYISKRAHHQWAIPRYMLEQGLMDQLKAVSTNLRLKDYQFGNLGSE